MEIISTLQYGKTYLVSTFLLFLILQSNLATAQDFKKDSILLERKTIAQNDSANISVVKKVFVKSRKVLDFYGFYQGIDEYIVNTEYWLFLNNNADSIGIGTYGENDQLINFIIYKKLLQNKINAVVLEYSEITKSNGPSQDSHRIFSVLNLDSKSSMFHTRQSELKTVPNGGAHGNFRHDIDTYQDSYSLIFDTNDNVKLIHTKAEIFRGGTKKLEQRKSWSEQLYKLTQVKDHLHYVISYDKK